jgi:hypothetical protein
LVLYAKMTAVRLALALVCLFSLAESKQCEHPATVRDVGPLEFFALSADKPALVEFYSPTCGHSRTFSHTFECAAAELDSKQLDVVRIIAGEPGVGEFTPQGVPALRFFARGMHSSGIVYEGDRSARGVADWARALAKTDAQTLLGRYPDAFPQRLAAEQAAALDDSAGSSQAVVIDDQGGSSPSIALPKRSAHADSVYKLSPEYVEPTPEPASAAAAADAKPAPAYSTPEFAFRQGQQAQQAKASAQHAQQQQHHQQGQLHGQLDSASSRGKAEQRAAAGKSERAAAAATATATVQASCPVPPTVSVVSHCDQDAFGGH